VKNMKVFSILIFFCELLVCEIHKSDFNLGLVKYLKVISTLILWNTWKWFQQWFCEPTRLWNTWKWFQHWFFFCEIHESDFNIGFFFWWNTWK
jgi:hypothetical protein